MIEIIPSILTNNPDEAQAMIERCENSVNRVSIDIIDGKYIANKSIDPSAITGIDTGLKLDFHLMVIDPVNWIESCVRAEADRIIGQIEYMKDQVEFVGKVQETGLYVGLGIDLDTPISKIDPTILTNLDVVLVMSVKAGFGGQEFDRRALKKIKQLDEIRVRDDTPYRIHDDGGITLETIHNVHKTGADEVSIGRRFFEGDIVQNLKKFQTAAHKLT